MAARQSHLFTKFFVGERPPKLAWSRSEVVSVLHDRGTRLALRGNILMSIRFLGSWLQVRGTNSKSGSLHMQRKDSPGDFATGNKLTWLALAEDHEALSRSLEQLMALPRSVKVKRVLLVSLAAKFLAEAASVRAAATIETNSRCARGATKGCRDRSSGH